MRFWLVFMAAMTAALIGGPARAADERVGGLPNIEDMAVTADGQWVIASSMAGGTQAEGALYIIDARTKAAHKAALAQVDGTARCPDGFDPSVLAPHGIALHTTPTESTLYVVNHGGRESIERFELSGDGGTPRLHWNDCIALPKGAFANAVAVAADGTLFVTNDGQALGAPDGTQGDLLSWTEKRGWQAIPASQHPAWNGIVVSKDGQRIYAAAWLDRKIFEFVRGAAGWDAAGPRRWVDTGFLTDNLHWAEDGTILLAGQDAAPDAVTGCYFSPAKVCGLKSGFSRLDPAHMTILCTRKLAAAPAFNTATSATAVNDGIWLGTTRGQSILVTTACTGQRNGK